MFFFSVFQVRIYLIYSYFCNYRVAVSDVPIYLLILVYLSKNICSLIWSIIFRPFWGLTENTMILVCFIAWELIFERNSCGLGFHADDQTRLYPLHMPARKYIVSLAEKLKAAISGRPPWYVEVPQDQERAFGNQLFCFCSVWSRWSNRCSD